MVVEIKFHNINGEIVPATEARVSVFDLGLLRGYGIFDFFPIRRGLPLFASDYFDRFFGSARAMSLQVPVDREALYQRVLDLIHHNGLSEGYIKLILTGGTSADGYTPGECNLYILQHIAHKVDPSYFTEGVRLLLRHHVRDTATVKTLNYAQVLRSRENLDQKGALDLLYHDGRSIHETSRANFFLIDQDNEIWTPKDTVLRGITRMKLIEVARSMNFIVHEDRLPIHKILEAKEAFISSTTKSAMPVKQINDFLMPHAREESVTATLREGFLLRCDSYLEARAAEV